MLFIYLILLFRIGTNTIIVTFVDYVIFIINLGPITIIVFVPIRNRRIK
jgi:hypothetical protein